MPATTTNSLTHNVCAKCETSFNVWSEYYHHINTVKCVRVIKPVNTSGRTRGEIVMNAERTWLKPFLVALMLSIASFSYANCGNDNGNGQGCSGGQVGPQGPAGPTGATGPQGPAGTNGTDGANGTNGTNGKDGVNGKDGANGQNAINPGARFLGELDVRLADTKHTSFYVFDSYNFNDSPGQDVVMDGRNAFYGFKFVVKLGKSYEEERIDKLEKEIAALRRK